MTPVDRRSAPPPDLRIVLTSHVHPHEEHDSQRASPLMERFQLEEFVIHPPIVAPMDDDEFLILDGANRCYAFSELDYPHILVQVVSYESGYIELDTWRHVVSGWDAEKFIQQLRQLPIIELVNDIVPEALCQVMLRDGRTVALCTGNVNLHERNAALREVVQIYQSQATLYRTAISDMEALWALYQDAIAIVVFPHYQPEDIMVAAREKAYLPPGISRHVVHGRALRVNYPLDALRNERLSLEQKNEVLQEWLQQKLAKRQVRYYAEATYQFDE